jgi:hypothetical protein
MKFKEEEKKLLHQQTEELARGLVITCECGKYCNVVNDAFRCLYCGIYRCKECSEGHFGMTVKDWWDQEEEE